MREHLEECLDCTDISPCEYSPKVTSLDSIGPDTVLAHPGIFGNRSSWSRFMVHVVVPSCY